MLASQMSQHSQSRATESVLVEGDIQAIHRGENAWKRRPWHCAERTSNPKWSEQCCTLHCECDVNLEQFILWICWSKHCNMYFQAYAAYACMFCVPLSVLLSVSSQSMHLCIWDYVSTISSVLNGFSPNFCHLCILGQRWADMDQKVKGHGHIIVAEASSTGCCHRVQHFLEFNVMW